MAGCRGRGESKRKREKRARGRRRGGRRAACARVGRLATTTTHPLAGAVVALPHASRATNRSIRGIPTMHRLSAVLSPSIISWAVDADGRGGPGRTSTTTDEPKAMPLREPLTRCTPARAMRRPTSRIPRPAAVPPLSSSSVPPLPPPPLPPPVPPPPLPPPCRKPWHLVAPSSRDQEERRGACARYRRRQGCPPLGAAPTACTRHRSPLPCSDPTGRPRRHRSACTHR